MPPATPPVTSEPPVPAPRWGRFGLALGVIAVCWLILLPALSRSVEFQRRAAAREAQGIHLSARFYTELDESTRAPVARLNAQSPWALWWPWPLPAASE